MIFVNLSVTNLEKSRQFLEGLGTVNEPKFRDDTAVAMTLSDSIHVMLLTHEKFSQFTSQPVADPKKAAQILLCLSSESGEMRIRQLNARSPQEGGSADPSPKQDYEVIWMDAAAAESGGGAIPDATL